MSRPASVVVLVSGSGTILQALLDAARGPMAEVFTVAGVVSDREDAHGLTRAREAGVATAVVRLADFDDRRTWDVAVAKAVGVFSPDLVVLAGFMKILGPAYLAEHGGRTINTHPALMPAFPGAHAVRDALAYGVTVTGVTVMVVDDGVDTGPVVAQRAVQVLDGDDETSLHERIKVVERELVVEVVTRMVRDGWSIENRKVHLG